MRSLNAVFRALVAVLVVLSGLFVAVAMAVVAAIFFLIRRPHASTRHVTGKRGRTFSNPPGDVIDVTATEVSVEPAKTT